MTIFLETNCLELPISMNGHRFQEGCPGAVWFDGSPSKKYCQNDGGQFPWWEACCSWNGEQCVPKGESGRIIYIYIYIYIYMRTLVHLVITHFYISCMSRLRFNRRRRIL